METYIEQYQAKQGGVTLHTWTEVHGGKKGDYSIFTGFWYGSRGAFIV